MSQQTLGTIDPAETTGLALAALLSGFGEAVETTHKGQAEPTYKKAGLFWLDDTTDPVWILKFYDGTTWISVLSIDTGANTISLTGSAAELGGLTSGQLLRSDADAFMQAALEARFGVHGGFGSGGNAGSGTDWGAAIWALGKSYDGTGYGASFDPGAQFYGAAWIRADHTAAIPEVGEGLYIYRNGTVVAAFGSQGTHLPLLDLEQSFEKIGTLNIGAVSVLNVTFDPNNYTEIRIEGKGIKPTDDLSRMRARFGRADGTVIAGNASYGTSASSPKDFMDVTFNEIKSAGPGLSFFMSVIGFADIPIVRGHTSYVRASDNVATLGGNNGVLRREVADGHVWDTVQLYFSASNFQAAGTITVYGMKA